MELLCCAAEIHSGQDSGCPCPIQPLCHSSTARTCICFCYTRVVHFPCHTRTFALAPVYICAASNFLNTGDHSWLCNCVVYRENHSWLCNSGCTEEAASWKLGHAFATCLRKNCFQGKWIHLLAPTNIPRFSSPLPASQDFFKIKIQFASMFFSLFLERPGFSD